MIGETRFDVKAAFDNETGAATVRVFGRCSFGEGEKKRDATEFVDITDEKILEKVNKVLSSAITEVRDELNRLTVGAAMKCGTVAMERGEI